MAATITFLRIGNRVSRPICVKCKQTLKLTNGANGYSWPCGCPRS